MMPLQSIVRVRRTYNQWVANQTLEDMRCALPPRAPGVGRPSALAMTALGGISFLALEVIGATITLSVGFTNAVAAILVVGPRDLPYQSADLDLHRKIRCRYRSAHAGAGFGYLGSTLTSLIYASFTFIFLAIEAAIMA